MMSENKKTIEERVTAVFRNKLGFPVDTLTPEQRQHSLLSDSIGMQARDLLKLYMELEKEFNMGFEDLVQQGDFDKYNCILKYIQEYGDPDGK